MVVLRIVFKDLRFLLVVKVSDEVIRAKILSPFLAVEEPANNISTVLP